MLVQMLGLLEGISQAGIVPIILGHSSTKVEILSYDQYIAILLRVPEAQLVIVEISKSIGASCRVLLLT